MMKRALIALTGAAFLMALAPQKSSAAEAAAPAYKLAGTIPLGPGERWDYATFGQGRVLQIVLEDIG